VRTVKCYVGAKFDHLEVVGVMDKRLVLCRCDCGTHQIIDKRTLAGGYKKHCGCKAIRKGHAIWRRNMQFALRMRLESFRRKWGIDAAG
jgi:hypothetical protein